MHVGLKEVGLSMLDLTASHFLRASSNSNLWREVYVSDSVQTLETLSKEKSKSYNLPRLLLELLSVKKTLEVG